ncbi:hypothetical protein Tco_0792382 [Tanacetum coccineum]
MLERGSYVPWASRFRRYIDRKRETRKFIHHSIDKGPYEMKKIHATETQDETTQKESRFVYEFDNFTAEPRESLSSVYNCFSQLIDDMDRNKIKPFDVTINTKFLTAYSQNGDKICDDKKDSLTTAMMLLARAITQRYSTPTNNRLRTSSNTRNQAVVQADRVNIQIRNVSNGGRFARKSSNTQGEFADSENV